MTMATDYALAAWVVWLGVRLLGPESQGARRFWAVAYLVGGATAAVGGTVHGFNGAFSLQTRSLLWDVIGSGIAAAALALLAGIAVATLRGSLLRLMLLALAARAVADVLSGAAGDFSFSIYDGIAALLGVLASGAHGLPSGAARRAVPARGRLRLPRRGLRPDGAAHSPSALQPQRPVPRRARRRRRPAVPGGPAVQPGSPADYGVVTADGTRATSPK